MFLARASLAARCVQMLCSTPLEMPCTANTTRGMQRMKLHSTKWHYMSKSIRRSLPSCFLAINHPWWGAVYSMLLMESTVIPTSITTTTTLKNVTKLKRVELHSPSGIEQWQPQHGKQFHDMFRRGGKCLAKSLSVCLSQPFKLSWQQQALELKFWSSPEFKWLGIHKYVSSPLASIL
jgi:hypothetical protein